MFGWCTKRSQAVQISDKAGETWLDVTDTLGRRGVRVVKEDNKIDEDARLVGQKATFQRLL